MTSLKEIKERGYMPNRIQIKLMTVGVYSIIKLFITSPGSVKKLQEGQAPNQRYKRPKRAYDVPEITSEMQCNCKDEKFLRPTRYCDHTKPEVVALAHKLGAGKLSDKEYVEKVFDFVKNHLHIEMVPFDGVENTLHRGAGTCYHLASVFIALCRCAGIKARYKLFAMQMIDAFYDDLIAKDEAIKKWYDSMGYFMLESEGEAFIDGEWVVAHVGPTPERQAAMGIHLTQLGEDSIGNWFLAKPGTIMHVESVPYGIPLLVSIGYKLAPGSMERFNLNIQTQHEHGKKVLSKYKDHSEYDKEARKKLPPQSPKVKIVKRKEIVFEDK